MIGFDLFFGTGLLRPNVVFFITTFGNGSRSLVPAFNRKHHNLWLLRLFFLFFFFLLPNFGSNIDHDDGSLYYKNVL